MYTNNRDAYRQFFFTTWQKHEKKLLLDAAESRLISIILKHPEYHYLFEKPEKWEHQEFDLAENPFFHMSLHYSIAEQVSTNRPAGITEIKQTLSTRLVDSHHAEHLMMEQLCHMMAKAQETGSTPGDEEYLNSLRGIAS